MFLERKSDGFYTDVLTWALVYLKLKSGVNMFIS